MLAAEGSSDFILSGHTTAQLKVLEQLSTPCRTSTPLLLYVEGPHRIWINKSPVKYFSLRLSVNDSRPIVDSDEGEFTLYVVQWVWGWGWALGCVGAGGSAK